MNEGTILEKPPSVRRSRWMVPIVLGAVLVLTAVARTTSRKPEIDAFPGLVGLEKICHKDVRGWEGWTFSGPGKSKDGVDRLDRILASRGWSRRGNRFTYRPFRPFQKALDFVFRPNVTDWSRTNSPVSIVVLPERTVPGYAILPPHDRWTTIQAESMHTTVYSGPGPFPMWTERP